MTEDYPRYPDIHDLDLALLNPRMIVVWPVQSLKSFLGVVGSWYFEGIGKQSSHHFDRGTSSNSDLKNNFHFKTEYSLCSQDVTPYMNSCPYTVSPNTRISQVFNLFRTMGLRHLPVVNAVGEVSSCGSKKSSCIKADTKCFKQMF